MIRFLLFNSKIILDDKFLVNAVKTDNNANVTAEQKTKWEDDSSEFSSELEEVYEQFSKWLEDPIIKENVEKLDPRDEAVLNFASSLLKRTLSESFVGVPLTEGCISSACNFTLKTILHSHVNIFDMNLVFNQNNSQVFQPKRIRCRTIKISRRIDKF